MIRFDLIFFLNNYIIKLKCYSPKRVDLLLNKLMVFNASIYYYDSIFINGKSKKLINQ